MSANEGFKECYKLILSLFFSSNMNLYLSASKWQKQLVHCLVLGPLVPRKLGKPIVHNKALAKTNMGKGDNKR